MGSEDRGHHSVVSQMRPAERFRSAKTAQKARRTATDQVGAAEKPAPSPRTQSVSPLVPVNRREFLTYAWASSLALLLASSGVSSFFFVLPRFKTGEFGGTFSVSLSQFPSENDTPVPNPEGKFWLVHVDGGYNVLYSVCTHLGCLYGWSEVNHRFECPCHGSKFEMDGTYIEGPAPRSLDRFEAVVQDAAGNVIAQSDAEGNAVQIQDPNATVLVDTSRRILGRHHHTEA